MTPWSEAEDDIVKTVWEGDSEAPLAVAAELLPGRTKGAIQIRASTKGHSRRRMARLGITPSQQKRKIGVLHVAKETSRAVIRPVPLVSGEREKVRLRLLRTMEALAGELQAPLSRVIATARMLAEDDFKANRELAMEAATNGDVALGSIAVNAFGNHHLAAVS